MRRDSLFFRIAIYCVGIALVSLGIVLCKEANLGISPISSVPYVLEFVLPLSFGTLTMFFHLLNTAAQMVMLKKARDLKLLLQVPLAFAFGQVINFFQKIVVVRKNDLLYQCAALALSVFFTALGMVCMLNMKLVSNPPDGIVKEISGKTGVKFGNVKVIYDVAMVAVSVLLGLLFCKRIVGIGIGTLVSAVFVGKCVLLINRMIARLGRRK